MGQYLSQPATEKESAEGYADALAYGLAAMQGWRVSMEDAHIADLDLDPATKTALFAVFDGHGGRAVSQYCAAHLATEFLHSEAYRRGDLATAITEAYYRLDTLLESDQGKAELRELVAASKPKSVTEGALFSDVESKLTGTSAIASDDRQHSTQSDLSSSLGENSDATGRSVGSDPAAGGRSSSGPARRSIHSGDREALEAEADKAMKKLGSSKDFLESHLMRASVLMSLDEEKQPRMTGSGAAAPRNAPINRQSGGSSGSAGLGAGGLLFPIESGELAHDPAAANGSGRGAPAEEGGEEEEEQHAAGMGATAVAVVIRGNRVLVANTGDSRCVLSKRGVARALTLDHKPILFDEAKRIIKAGGFVRDNRINGALNVSRTIGDLDFKRNGDLPHDEQMVVATPDIEQFLLEDGDEFLIIACDGIWDVLTNQEAVDFVRKRLKAGESLKTICEAMCDACLAPDLKGLCRGADNMSVIVVLFRKHARLGGFWSSLLAACGRTPAYARMPSSSERHRR